MIHELGAVGRCFADELLCRWMQLAAVVVFTAACCYSCCCTAAVLLPIAVRHVHAARNIAVCALLIRPYVYNLNVSVAGRRWEQQLRKLLRFHVLKFRVAGRVRCIHGKAQTLAAKSQSGAGPTAAATAGPAAVAGVGVRQLHGREA